MRVVATETGYYNGLRYKDDEFDVEDGVKATWFRPVKEAAEAKPKRKAKEGNADESV